MGIINSNYFIDLFPDLKEKIACKLLNIVPVTKQMFIKCELSLDEGWLLFLDSKWTCET